MQWVQKAVQYYKDINPATLTGAIDVIVVERPSAHDPNELELACSPFHVRFGKLSVLRPIDKKVRITVNDEAIPFYMKVGETGEAFFVFETDKDVPEELQTSPLASPVPDPEDEAPGEPEFLDLDASGGGEGNEDAAQDEDDDDYSPSSSRYTSLNPTQLNSPTQTIRQLPFLSSPSSPIQESPEELQDSSTPTSSVGEADEQDTTESSLTSAREKAAKFVPSTLMLGTENVVSGLGKMALTSLSSGLGNNKKLKDVVSEEEGRKPIQVDASTGQASADGTAQVGELGEEMSEELRGLSLHDEKDKVVNGDSENQHELLSSPGEEVRRAARANDKDLYAILGTPHGLGRAQSFDGEVGPDSPGFSMKTEETGLYELDGAGLDVRRVAPLLDLGAPETTGDLMLDMSGYKLESTGEEETNDPAKTLLEGDQQPLVELNAPLDDRGEEEIVAFTQGLLQSTDPKTLRGFFDPSDSSAPSSRAASPTPPPEDDPRLPLRPESISSLQTLVAESTELEPSPNDGVFQTSPMQFSLKVGGRLHVFELSLCGGDDFGQSPIRDQRSFTEHQVSFGQFMEHDDITDHGNLVVKYGGRFLTWDNASPVLASLAVYRKSLVDHPEHHKRLIQEGINEEDKRPSRWGSWWNRKAESTTSLPLPTQDTTPPVSPPTSTPASPRSLPLPSSPPPLTPLAAATELPPLDEKRHYAKTLRLTSDQLKELGLKKGMNVISFSVRSSYSGFATCTSRIFLWESDFQVVISDIDGTITKSDALGHVFTMIGRDWTHLGVAKLYTDIARNGYKMMYLTSRAIGQADTTREYLKGIKQNGFVLPDGPVIMSPDRLMTSLHREVVLRKPEVFKMACLRDIQRLFGDRSPFYAGFGNRITDALSYRSVDVPSSRIFTIDSNGEVKMELLELAGYKSSYIHMHDLVDQMFPPINRKTAPAFTDFNFWRAPVMHFELPDLSPPSPALSARSDSSSRLTFPRLGSLASSLSRRSSRGTLSDPPPSRSGRGATPSSPLLQATVVEESFNLNDDDLEEDDRSESGSMPGSLPNASDMERYRAAAKNRALSEAEAYKEAVVAGDEGDEEEEEGDEEYEDGVDDVDDLDQLDFSSVPYL